MTKITFNKVPAHPNLDKMLTVKDDSHKLGEFIDWLSSNKGVILAMWGEANDENEEPTDYLYPCNIKLERLLAEYFEIDYDAMEKEKKAILEYTQTMYDE